MADNGGKKWCIVVLLCVLLIFCSIFFPTIVDQKDKYDNYEKELCTISNIEYPQNYESSYMWGKCKCGKRCYAYSPIIKMYVKIENNSKWENKTFLLNTGMEETSYTIFSSRCSDGKKPEFMIKSLEWSKRIYTDNINTTISCYVSTEHNNAIIMIEDPLESVLFYSAVIVMGIILCCIGCTFLCFKRD